jgi:hypothetical protein
LNLGQKFFEIIWQKLVGCVVEIHIETLVGTLENNIKHCFG